VRFVRRRQGLILPRGNPRRVRTLADVAQRRLRFVNRQRGSGTRVLVDQLLHAQHVDPSSVRGYATEEFTHLAVAATVAAGNADAGFGLEAAARQFRLAFVPVVEERYLLACRRSALRQPAVARLRELLATRAARRAIVRLAGYAPDRPGELLELADLRALSAAPAEVG
jgi:molybdate-binding protein